MANFVTYDFTGGTDYSKAAPNIEGTALAVNMYTQSNTEGDNKDQRTFLKSCPGIRYFDAIGTGDHCDGIFVPSVGLEQDEYKPSLFVANGGNVYRLSPDGTTKERIGGYAIGNPVYFAETGGERAILLWVDSYNIFGYELKTGAIPTISLPAKVDGDDFIHPTHIAVVDGSIVLNDKDSSYVYYSIKFPLNTATREVFDIVDGEVQYEEDGITVKTVTVNSGTWCFYDDYHVQKYFNASASSDKCTALAVTDDILTLYGPTSIEFWKRGDAESYQTWQRISHTNTGEYGLAAPFSVVTMDNCQLFIGTLRGQVRTVNLIKGTEVVKVSPYWLNELLRTDFVDNIRAWCYTQDGHNFYLLSIGSTCYAYDTTTGQWHTRVSRNYYSATVEYYPLFACGFNGKIITGSCSSNILYELDPEYYYEELDSEHKLPLQRIRQTPLLTADNKPYLLQELTIECTTGAMDTYGEQGKVLLQVSKDGGYTYGNILEGITGQRGQYNIRVRWLNLGMSRQSVLRITYTEPTDYVLSNGSLRIQPLNYPI